MFGMRDLTLIIPAKKEVESLPVFLKEILYVMVHSL